ncbi:tyrosine-type recombinase/integrase [Paraburkholderia sediminicola]|uniref:tyrosine-type recombinase/integrase n=1 Tax=Paraburkholderia sediminicola TaxID=458836 RepID=UPI0038BB0845
MPKQINRLTELQCRTSKPADKPHRLYDGHGLYLQVMPTGSRYWRLKYRLNDKEKLLALGVYPEVSLLKARESVRVARDLLRNGTDPSEQTARKKRAREEQASKIEAASSFEAVAREWLANQKDGWSPRYAKKILGYLEVDAFPRIGQMAIGDIEAPHIVDMVRAIEARGVRETAKRVLQLVRAVFEHAIIERRCKRNPAADINAKVLLKKGVRVRHMPRVEALEIPDLMRGISAYKGELITRLALRFMALTFARTSEMINAKWGEFGETEWRIPAERMKMRRPHIVPLSRQALEVLAQLRAINGHRDHVFYSSQSNGPISLNTMLYALYRMKYKSRMTVHGFRGLAATVLRELGYDRDIVDLQLAHAERNQVTAAYVHAEYLSERRVMMQEWSDYLDTAESKPSA